MSTRKLLKITDNDGLIEEKGKLFKAHHYGSNHTIVYKEINPEEYDKRIRLLAESIAKSPEVILLDVIKDALYDLPLKLLDKFESKLSKEEDTAIRSNSRPRIATITKNRGTCVDLTIGNKVVLNLRQ